MQRVPIASRAAAEDADAVGGERNELQGRKLTSIAVVGRM
jgi:hypothetical protein